MGTDKYSTVINKIIESKIKVYLNKFSLIPKFLNFNENKENSKFIKKLNKIVIQIKK